MLHLGNLAGCTLDFRRFSAVAPGVKETFGFNGFQHARGVTAEKEKVEEGNFFIDMQYGRRYVGQRYAWYTEDGGGRKNAGRKVQYDVKL